MSVDNGKAPESKPPPPPSPKPKLRFCNDIPRIFCPHASDANMNAKEIYEVGNGDELSIMIFCPRCLDQLKGQILSRLISGAVHRAISDDLRNKKLFS